MNISYNRVLVGDVDFFYREAGDRSRPTLLLLHGFPTASNMFNGLIPHLASDYHIIAPDLPGFGETRSPSRSAFDYTFDHLAKTIEQFTDTLELRSYALFIFDYGAPVGLRLAMARPDRVTAIISQNGNAYEEGLSPEWGPWQAYWREPTPEHREACRAFLTDDAIRAQHEHGAGQTVSPDDAKLDIAYMRQGEREEIQLDLILDYRSNVALYPAFQSYLRDHQPPFMAAWGRNDAFFLPAGALAYMRDLPRAEVHLLDAGHFALATRAGEIGELVNRFLAQANRIEREPTSPST